MKRRRDQHGRWLKSFGFEELAMVIERLPETQRQAAIRGARSAAYRLEGMVKDSIASTTPYPPQDTGELTRSVKTTPIPRGALVAADAPHAPFMEFGTRPHFPPTAPLAEWAYRKGLADSEEEAQGIAFSIARKIATRGLAPRHFMARAIDEFKRLNILRDEIIDELEAAGWTG